MHISIIHNEEGESYEVIRTPGCGNAVVPEISEETFACIHDILFGEPSLEKLEECLAQITEGFAGKEIGEYLEIYVWGSKDGKPSIEGIIGAILNDKGDLVAASVTAVTNRIDRKSGKAAARHWDDIVSTVFQKDEINGSCIVKK